jgi:hypothetical protein
LYNISADRLQSGALNSTVFGTHMEPTLCLPVQKLLLQMLL